MHRHFSKAKGDIGGPRDGTETVANESNFAASVRHDLLKGGGRKKELIQVILENSILSGNYKATIK